ncbi:MFS transporter [Nocardia sp. NPDC055029]
MSRTSGPDVRSAPRGALIPLALAQFICSFAGSNDLDTTVQGVQVAITIFLLVMAALMIPGGKLTERYGRQRCFLAGLLVYGIGALLSAVAPGRLSGLSRSVSNLGSSLGTALTGTILVAGLTGHAYAAAMITLAGIGGPRLHRRHAPS